MTRQEVEDAWEYCNDERLASQKRCRDLKEKIETYDRIFENIQDKAEYISKFATDEEVKRK